MIRYHIAKIDARKWYLDIQNFMDTQLNDITPAVLYSIHNCRITDKSHHIFDRGKPSPNNHNIIENTKTIKSQPAYQTKVTHDTDHWTIDPKGFWRDEAYHGHHNAKVAQLTVKQMQSDSEDNGIITDNLQLLKDIVFIQDYPMGGCNKDDIAIVCTAKGKLTLYDTFGKQLLVEVFYSKQVDGTIVSPTTIV